jgi:hypothetical protein
MAITYLGVFVLIVHAIIYLMGAVSNLGLV